MKVQTNPFRLCRIFGIAIISLSALSSAQEKAPSKEAPAAEAKAEPELTPEQVKDNASMALGLRAGADFARQFAHFGVKLSDLDMDSFIKGFNIAYKEEDLTESEEKLQAAMQAFGMQIQEREKKLAEENKAAGEKFLEANAKKEGVTTNDSGLQYEVIKKGEGKVYGMPNDPEAPQKIYNVQYKGTLIDGTQFDASPEGETVPFTLQVVPGFREALTTMPVGSKWKLFLSPDLAYGERRASSKIEPNSTLIFELELKSVEDAPQQPQGLPFQIPGQ